MSADLPSTTIPTLGESRIPSPLPLNDDPRDPVGNFTPDQARIRYRVEEGGISDAPDLWFEKAGPRSRMFFDPARVTAAIVTCGGLCPGLNNVIRSAYRELCNYGVRQILGIRYGYRGLDPAAGLEPCLLNDALVDTIHREGGTVLGSSRGGPPTTAQVDWLQQRKVNILLTIGGDGTQRGSRDIAQEARRRGHALAAVGIPKTIDNDIQFVRRTFGFATAVDVARSVLSSAHAEARAYPNGVVVVKVMGRDSGFIAAAAAVASQEVNFALIPEVPFRLEGNHGLLANLKRRLQAKGHALIVVAEGAGQDLQAGGLHARDASGNILHKDIGLFLRDQIAAYFKTEGIEISLKYIDPSYLVRSVPANSEDAVLCDTFARHAVHAAMAGKTEVVIGHWNDFIHVPTSLATAARRKVTPDSLLWNQVLSATGQPASMM